MIESKSNDTRFQEFRRGSDGIDEIIKSESLLVWMGRTFSGGFAILSIILGLFETIYASWDSV